VGDLISDQHEKWSETFLTRPDFLGSEPSAPGRAALARFVTAGAAEVLELGPGQGRDTLLFVEAGLRVIALDFADAGLAQIAAKADASGLGAAIQTLVGDVRDPLPLADASVGACYAHMLLCMALSTAEIEQLVAEVRRVLRPDGLFVYTVRTTADAHFRVGIDHGDDRWETGGFIVHFFDGELIERLADGFELLEVADYDEGSLPRRLAAVTMRKWSLPSGRGAAKRAPFRSDPERRGLSTARSSGRPARLGWRPEMLEQFPINAIAAAVDLDRARRWYEEKLGAKPQKEDPGGLWYRFGGETWLYLYSTSSAGTARNTIAGWTVKGIEAVMADLRTRGVVFEDYDFGENKTVDGLMNMGEAKAAWFKDSEGNTYEISEVI
jgi:SAM-dependent methyltransferase/catechol 2,3-dioxygenase-like lactoylglutathione lyase family enzyme